MKQYLDMLKFVLDRGHYKDDRTGTGTISVFGYQNRYDLDLGFPLLTTKKINIKSIIYELLWFLSGDTNIRYLVQNNVNIWNEWPFQNYLKSTGLDDQYPMYSEAWKKKMSEFIDMIKSNDDFAKTWGDLGPVYGKQWRNWTSADGKGIDQMDEVVKMITTNPNSRRIVVSGWNVYDIQKLIQGRVTAPPPCHTLFQFYVNNGKLSCQLYQRSADIFLGVPFNIASYSLLTIMLAQVCKLEPGEFIHTFGDLHLYKNHLDQAKTQLERVPKTLPKMKLNPTINSLFDFRYEDFSLSGYDPYPHIKAQVAV